ncbi:MAG TPA: ATP-binding protein [Nostocaceae cyanobacterium]|nr:ATP-binding protein [Nostocaceae cyanobacterium]
METIIFIGIQGSGKSTFYKENFFNTHIRINLDMLKTRHREKIIFQACLKAKQKFVIDNTNPTIEDRQRYIPLAKSYGFKIIAYYFQVNLEDCKIRNQQRPSKQIIPIPGILATYKKLTPPTWQEGFDNIYTVKNDLNKPFIIEEWTNEI